MENQDQIFQMGDKLKMTNYYLTNYPSWNIGENEIILLSLRQVKVKIEGKNFDRIPAYLLDKDTRPLYQSVFGIQTDYLLYEFMVKIGEQTFTGSNLGFQKG